jgi:ABC-type amino acid transport substrate-binding protein
MRLAVALTLLAAALAYSTPAAADLPEIKARGTLRVIAAEGEQPEMFDFEGDPSKPGLEREMLEGFARVNGVKLEVVKVKTFAERIPALLRGDGDLIVGLVDTPERRKQVDFTDEILPVQHVVVSAKPRPPVASLEAFRSKHVGTIRGTTWARETAAAGVPDSQVELFADTDPMLDALVSGEVEAAVMTFSDFTLAAKRRPSLEAGVRVGKPASAAWGVRRQDVKLRAALDSHIENLRNGPSWNRLIVVYFGERARSVLGRTTK